MGTLIGSCPPVPQTRKLVSDSSSGPSLTGSPAWLSTATLSRISPGSSHPKHSTLSKRPRRTSSGLQPSLFQDALTPLTRRRTASFSTSRRAHVPFKTFLASLAGPYWSSSIEELSETFPAFPDINTLVFVHQLNWVEIAISQWHDFCVVGLCLPRTMITDGLNAEDVLTAMTNHPCSQIRMRHNLLCNNDVLQNVVLEGTSG